jgi:hypothetical protein
MRSIVSSIAFVILFGIVSILLLAGYGSYADNTSRNISSDATRSFVNAVLSKGYVDNRDYLDFREQLDSTSQPYDVELIYYKKKFQPDYVDPNNFLTFKDSFEVTYEKHFTKEILDVIFPSTNYSQDDPIRRFKLSSGDMFKVKIKPKQGLLMGRILAIIYPVSKSSLPYWYSGRV